MPAIWRHYEGRLFATTLLSISGSCYHLSVEGLPDYGWDWVVWRAGDPDRLGRYGVASSAKRARAKAERVAADMQAQRSQAAKSPATASTPEPKQHVLEPQAPSPLREE